MLVHVWGLGLGVTSAYAAAGDPATELVSSADAPALLDRLTGSAVPAVEREAAPVGQVLQERIRAGGLPLPGQATTVPDAFSIAAVLLPSVPPQPRGDDAPRASRSVPTAGEGRAAATGMTGPVQRAADTRSDVAHPVSAQVRRAATDSLGQPTAAVRVEDADPPPTEQQIALTATAPVGSGDDCTAVLVPIGAGMLLTGAAMYKHRGIPRGH